MKSDAGITWQNVRAIAHARAETLGLPNNALEDWRYVNLKPLTAPFISAAHSSPILSSLLSEHTIPNMPLLVLVDGVIDSSLSHSDSLACGLNDLPETERSALINTWIATLSQTNDITECWSIAGCAGGAHIRANTSSTLHIISVSTGLIHGGRLVIDVHKNSALQLVVSHLDLAPSRASIGIEAIVHDSGKLQVDEVQYALHHEKTATLLTAVTVTVGRDASVSWTTVSQGGSLVRFRSQVQLQAPGAEITCCGLSALDEQRQAHFHTRVVHAAPHTTSRQLFKNIADGQAIASFDGLVTIMKGADGSSAQQTNHNLLLSSKARIDTRPQLDIHADDVKASHGATVGRPNPDELFYLRSRGLPATQAMTVLMRGFTDDVLSYFTNESARSLARHHIRR